MTPPPLNGSALEAPMDEDKRLVLAFKGGETDESYAAIYERHSDTVRRVCRRMLTNPQDAEEAFQETFLKVYRALGRFNGRYQLGAWITRIATNVCLDQIRSKARHPVKSVEPESLDVDLESAVAIEDADPEYQVIRRQESRHVRRVLEQLPPKHRAAIILRDFECLSYAEVATALDITECQTKALIHRARKSFKRSWSAPLAALLPWRWAQKFRRIELADQSTQWMPASHAVASCSNAFQQCGQFVFERVAPVATAVVLGTATGAALTQHGPPANTTPEQTVVETRENDSVTLTRALAKRTETKKTRQQTGPIGEPAEPTDEPVEPEGPTAEEPDAPAPEPTTAPEPVTPGGGGPAPTHTPTPTSTPPPPPPAGFSMSVALEGRAEAGSCCAVPNGAESTYVGITSAGIQSFDQVLNGTVPADGNEYGLWLRHITTSGSSHSMDFRLKAAEGGFFYSATGNLVKRVQTAWNGWTYTYSGTYQMSSRPGGAPAMPTSGRYTLTVSASWEENRIVSTHVTLHQGG